MNQIHGCDICHQIGLHQGECQVHESNNQRSPSLRKRSIGLVHDQLSRKSIDNFYEADFDHGAGKRQRINDFNFGEGIRGY